jgi:hypothetical protein
LSEKLNTDVDKLEMGIMDQIYQSRDQVSKILAPIFTRAVAHSRAELQRAKERRERGNPPGKGTSPVGDQLSWEQILTRFAGKKRLWVISRDGDYGTIHEGRGFLNLFLYEELRRMNPHAQAFLFDDIADGIKDFADKTGEKAEKLPTPEEAKEIKKEEQQLPPLDWLGGNALEAANIIARRSWRQGHPGAIIQPITGLEEVSLDWLQPGQPIISHGPTPPEQPPRPRTTIVQNEPPPGLFEVKQPPLSTPAPPQPQEASEREDDERVANEHA